MDYELWKTYRRRFRDASTDLLRMVIQSDADLNDFNACIAQIIESATGFSPEEIKEMSGADTPEDAMAAMQLCLGEYGLRRIIARLQGFDVLDYQPGVPRLVEVESEISMLVALEFPDDEE